MKAGLWLLAAALACLSGMALAEPDAETKAGGAAGKNAPGFDLLEFRVKGNSVLSREAIESAVYPSLGPGKTITDVEQARAALEKAYHDAGYQTVYVSVPEQKVENGIVKLQVNEGVIERTRVAGAQYTLPSRIHAEVPSAAEGKVPNFPDMQQDLETANRAPGVRVTPVLEPGRMPGTTVMELKVKDVPPESAWLDFNNAHSANTSNNRLAGGVSYSNLFQRSQTLSLQYQTSPGAPSESSAVSASYVIPLSEYTRYLSFYGVHSTSNVTNSAINVGDQILFGNNDIVGTRYIMPLQPWLGMRQQLVLGADFKDSRQDASGISTPLRYWTLDANYGLGFDDAGGSWQFGAGTVLGLRGPGSDDAAFDARRYHARGSFAVVKLNAARTQKLPAGWSLMEGADAQLADQPLINNEQFSAGGAGSVRGYLQSEATGDKGVHASLELRAPEWSPKESLLKGVQPYLFADVAYLRVIDALPAETDRFKLASLGLGLNLRAGRALSMSLSLADPLFDGPKNDLSTSPPQPYTKAHQLRAHFDTRLDF